MPLMFWGKYSYSVHSYNCGLSFGDGVHKYYFLFYAVTVILIPVTFTVFNFTGILIDLNSSSLGDGRKMLDSNKGAILTLLVLTLAFVICSLPLFVTAIILWFEPAKAQNVPPEISIAFHWMLYMNSAVNPLLYGLFNPKLRNHYISILTCKDKNKVSWVQSIRRPKKKHTKLVIAEPPTVINGANGVKLNGNNNAPRTSKPHQNNNKVGVIHVNCE